MKWLETLKWDGPATKSIESKAVINTTSRILIRPRRKLKGLSGLVGPRGVKISYGSSSYIETMIGREWTANSLSILRTNSV